MAANNNRKGAGMRIKMEVGYSECEVAEMVRTAHMARFGAAPDGMEWEVNYTYSGRFDVTAVEDVVEECDGKEKEAASE